jgi:hypothetical protein
MEASDANLNPEPGEESRDGLSPSETVNTTKTTSGEEM